MTSNERQNRSIYLPLGCLLGSLFTLTTQTTPNLYITGHLYKESTIPCHNVIMLNYNDNTSPVQRHWRIKLWNICCRINIVCVIVNIIHSVKTKNMQSSYFKHEIYTCIFIMWNENYTQPSAKYYANSFIFIYLVMMRMSDTSILLRWYWYSTYKVTF